MSYNLLSSSRRLLKRHKRQVPSLVLFCHPGYVRIEDSQGNAIADGPATALVDAVYSERLRADLVEALELADVKYYEGCLIVDVHEYRGASISADPSEPIKASAAAHDAALAMARPGRTFTPSQHAMSASKTLRGAGGGDGNGSPSIYRVALSRTSQTLWTELGLLFSDIGMTQQEAVVLEGKILTVTTPPLCLDPSFEVTRIANRMLAHTTGQERPALKRKAVDAPEANEAQRDAQRELQRERERLQQCNPSLGSKPAPSFDRFNYVSQWRSDRENRKLHPEPIEPHSAGASLPVGVGPTSLSTRGGQPGVSAGYGAAPSHLASLGQTTGSPAPSLNSSKGAKAAKPAKAKQPDPSIKAPAAKRKKAAAAAAATAAANRGPSIAVDPSYAGTNWP